MAIFTICCISENGRRHCPHRLSIAPSIIRTYSLNSRLYSSREPFPLFQALFVRRFINLSSKLEPTTKRFTLCRRSLVFVARDLHELKGEILARLLLIFLTFFKRPSWTWKAKMKWLNKLDDYSLGAQFIGQINKNNSGGIFLSFFFQRIDCADQLCTIIQPPTLRSQWINTCWIHREKNKNRSFVRFTF